jgi:hypothetical protein
VLEGTEECDTNDFGGLTCADFDAPNGDPFDSGSLSCNVNCTIDTSGCSLCGDDAVGGSEMCDGTDLGGASCTGQGFDGGTLACNATCDGFDTSACYECGDGTVDTGEECDGGVGGADCVSEGFDGGTLACGNDCMFDTSGCYLCGNGVLEPPEVCDCGGGACTPAQLGDTDCTDLAAPQNGNYTGGTLACNGTCDGFDEGACTWCGDGTKNGSEMCDGNDLDGATCVDAGWLPGGGGTVSCNAQCGLDDSLCTGTQCGGSMTPPPDGAGTCTGSWTDTGSACWQNCPFPGCDSQIDCPADRNCELECHTSNSCSGSTINCDDGHSCEVTCSNTNACRNATINCPSNADCTVTCNGTWSCQNATVVCPTENYACDVTCSGGTSACDPIEIQCGGGPCSIDCSNTTWVCDDADLICGVNSCTATCAGSSTPDLTCGTSCSCEPC